MTLRTGLIFCTLLLGSLAIPVPDNDLPIFFVNSDLDVPDTRIVGGNVAATGSHPWMVAFTIGGSSRIAHCGGSVISSSTVLTAAHCITPVQFFISTVRLNVGTNLFASGGQSLSVSGSVVHPQYNAQTIKNDIGIMWTASNIVFNNLVRAIPVSYAQVDGGVSTRVAGWGRTSANAAASQQLLELTVPTVDPNACVRDVAQAAIDLNFVPPTLDPRIEICTFHSRGRGTCRGDSGSPLINQSNSQQIGVVSWGFPCALGAPDVYVRVSAFQAWIQQNTR